MPLGIGIVGAGRVGQIAHLATFSATPGARIVALADLRPELAERAAAQYNVPRVYASHHDLLADPEVEAVVVVVRRPATAPIVFDALMAGRHVLAEKPLALTLADAAHLASVASARERHLAVGYMKRHDAGIALVRARLRRLTVENRLGELVRVRVWGLGGADGSVADGFTMTTEPRPDGLAWWATAPDWLPEGLRPAHDALLNVHGHLINLVRYLIPGTYRVAYADITDPARSVIVAMVDEHVPVVFELSDSRSGAWTEGLELRFEHVTVRVDLPPPFAPNGSAAVRLAYDDGTDEELSPEDPVAWAFARQAAAFVDDIRAGREPRASGADTLADHAFVEDAWRLVLGFVPVGAEGRPERSGP